MSNIYPEISWKIANATTVKNCQGSICNRFIFLCRLSNGKVLVNVIMSQNINLKMVPLRLRHKTGGWLADF